jgi:hypothetical protein
MAIASERQSILIGGIGMWFVASIAAAVSNRSE